MPRVVHVGDVASAVGQRSLGTLESNPTSKSRPKLTRPVPRAARLHRQKQVGVGSAETGPPGGEQEEPTARSGLQAPPSAPRRPPALPLPTKAPARPQHPAARTEAPASSSPSCEVSRSEEEETPTGNACPATRSREWRLDARPAGKYRARARTGSAVACLRVSPLPRPLRFPAEPGWASQPANTWRGLRSPRRLSFVFLLSFVLFLLMKDAFVDILSIIEIQDKYKDFRRQ